MWRWVVAARIDSRLDTPGLATGSKRTSVSESVTALLMRLVIVFGSSSRAIVPWGESADFDILLVGCCRSMIRAPTGGMAASGTTSVSPKRWLNRRARSRAQLEVLALVVAHRDPVGVVGEDVGGHQDRVVEQAHAHRLLALALVLELGHPAQLAHRGDAVEDPGQLGVGRDVALHEEDAPVGVEPGGEQQRRGASGPGDQLGRVVRERDRVEVDDAVDRVVGVLVGDPLPHGPEVVAQVHVAGRLDARRRPVPRPGTLPASDPWQVGRRAEARPPLRPVSRDRARYPRRRWATRCGHRSSRARSTSCST